MFGRVTESPGAAGFDDGQEFGLRGEGEFADFIEEEGSSVGALEESFFIG
jgi:hypothetical protein